MRTTLEIDAEMLDKVQKITGESSKGRAVDRALESFIRQDAIEKLLAMRGKLNLRSRSEWHDQDLQLEIDRIERRKRRHGNS